VIAAVGCLLWASCTVQDGRQTQLYTDPQFGFRVTCPDSGWTLTDQTGIPEVLVVITSETTVEDFIPNVTVSVEPLESMITAEEYGERNLASLTAQGYEVLALGKTTINQNTFYDLQSVYRQVWPPLLFRHLCLVKRRMGFVITCTVPENHYQRCENDFQFIVNSFRFL
jgi:hypothetical protein